METMYRVRILMSDGSSHFWGSTEKNPLGHTCLKSFGEALVFEMKTWAFGAELVEAE